MENVQRSGFSDIKYLVGKAAENHHLQEYYIKYKIFQAWDKIAPGFFADAENLTKPVDFCKGKLTIACLSESLTLQIRQVAKQILRALNELLGRQLVFVIAIEG